MLLMGLPFRLLTARYGRKEGKGTMKYVPAILLLLTASCTAHPYTVCRGEEYCTPALTHEEAIRASEIKKTWQDEKLYVRPVKSKDAT
jgi:hypothetical protein